MSETKCPICGKIIDSISVMEHIYKSMDEVHDKYRTELKKKLKTFFFHPPEVDTYDYIKLFEFDIEFDVFVFDLECAHIIKNIDLHDLYWMKNKISRYRVQFDDDQRVCELCSDCAPSKRYYVDGDKNNILPTNIRYLCKNCYDELYPITHDLPYLTISKKASFDSAHFLPNYDGKCSNTHGHRWDVKLKITRRLSAKTEMIMDFKDLKYVMEKSIINKLDHKTINDFITNPTAENIAYWIWLELMFNPNMKGLEEIKVWETPDSCCSFNKSQMLESFKFAMDKLG